ncbi:hypothetical protein O6382_24265, partial [Salmonella enterica subsp. enterica]
MATGLFAAVVFFAAMVFCTAAVLFAVVTFFAAGAPPGDFVAVFADTLRPPAAPPTSSVIQAGA